MIDEVEAAATRLQKLAHPMNGDDPSTVTVRTRDLQMLLLDRAGLRSANKLLLEKTVAEEKPYLGDTGWR